MFISIMKFSPISGITGEKGFAVPVVLVISMIIIAIVTSITYTVRQKIRMAEEINGRSKAYMKSYSALNTVLYNISTATFSTYALDIHEPNGDILKWNLYGNPIEIEKGVTVKLRDASGMISPLFDEGYLYLALNRFYKKPEKIRQFTDTLADWQDSDDFKHLNGAESFDYKMAKLPYSPRNFYIQTLDELNLLLGFDPEMLNILKDDLIYWRPGHINCMTMSKEMLQALLPGANSVKSIVDSRDQWTLTHGIFKQITGFQESEDVIFFPFGWIKIEINATEGNATDHIEAVVVKSQRELSPFWFAEWKR
jgi:general secretion pathway protein K